MPQTRSSKDRNAGVMAFCQIPLTHVSTCMFPNARFIPVPETTIFAGGGSIGTRWALLMLT